MKFFMELFKRVGALAFALLTLLGAVTGAFAADVEDATIDMSRTGSITVYKYDFTNAEKDGVWDSSYVSTGVYDANVNQTLGGTTPKGADSLAQTQGNGDTSNGYAIKNVEFTYLKVGDFRTWSELDASGVNHIELLYGIASDSKLPAAIGLSTSQRVTDADDTVNGKTMYYYRSSVLQKALSDALEANATTVKNALESYIASNGGTAMPETDSDGKTEVSGLPLGLYLVVETKVPEYVTDTTEPFFVTLPMTSVNGNNASDGGEEWLYDLTLYPKNMTGNPTLEKTVREAAIDTGKNTGTDSITDGYKHTATGSAGDVMEYQIISTLPTITSSSTYLSEYTFEDKLAKGLTYNRDVTIEFFSDEACTESIAVWHADDSPEKFKVTYGTDSETGKSVMTIAMTETGLNEMNTSKAVYNTDGAVNSGYSKCTLRITYSASVKSTADLVCGESGNTNTVKLTWARSNPTTDDILIDDCHVLSFILDLTKQFVDDNGDFAKVNFLLHNDTDNYYVTANFNSTEGVYYVTGHVEGEENATVFVPTDSGKIIVKGLEDDTYTLTETQTDNGYSLLKDDVEIIITAEESDELCSVYDDDILGLVQNDPRYTDTQKHLEHKLLTASATVDGNEVTMGDDNGSVHASVLLTIVNDIVFNLPRTGSYGNWMFPVIGLSAAFAAAGIVFLIIRKGKKSY